jgi:hypothetical protein
MQSQASTGPCPTNVVGYPCTQVIFRVHPGSAWPYTFHETGLCVKPLLLQVGAPFLIRHDCFFVSTAIGQIQHRLQGHVFPSNGESGPCIGILLAIRDRLCEIDAPWAIVLRQGQVLYEGDRASMYKICLAPLCCRISSGFAACILSLIVHCCLYNKSTTTLHCRYTQKHCTESFSHFPQLLASSRYALDAIRIHRDGALSSWNKHQNSQANGN